ncbi:MAG TPA: sigma-70 family RNA polymerase sigma factor [Chthoniobacteraceae bacterium]|nr:sigma-70 family RNA polymerase sigma factor [Chthoniobacteraceae bacterium]
MISPKRSPAPSLAAGGNRIPKDFSLEPAAAKPAPSSRKDGPRLVGSLGTASSALGTRASVALKAPVTPSIPEEESDERLMARLVDQEPEALERLFGRYSQMITGVIYHVVRDEAETEEVLNEVFLHTWNQAATYSPDKGKALGWLVTMARRRGIDRLRKRQRYAAAKERFEEQCRPDPHSELDTSLETEHADLRRFIETKMAELPPAQSEVIRYAFFKGMSQREIAAMTGIPLGTVKTRIELGLRKLSVMLRAVSAEW